MAKKSKRRARAQAPARQSAPAQPRTRVETAQAAPARTTADIAGEYRYVIGDLKRVGILAAATVTVSPTLVVSESQRWLPAAFAAMHLGYGLGFWEGAIRRIVSGSRGRVR